MPRVRRVSKNSSQVRNALMRQSGPRPHAGRNAPEGSWYQSPLSEAPVITIQWMRATLMSMTG